MQEVFIEVSKAVFAICDSESMYIYNLMEYVHSRKGEEFEVQAFTGVESLCACAKEKTIEILLISGKLLCEQVRELQIRKVMVLSEGEQICELSEYSAVYKYQPADSLIAEVMDSYARVKEAPAAALFKPEVEVTGIYSPVKRTGKTSFALTLGQLLASTKAVLYLNLEEYAGFDVTDLEKLFTFGDDFAIFIAFFTYQINLLLKRLKIVIQFLHFALKSIVIETNQIQRITSVSQPVNKRCHIIYHRIFFLTCIFHFNDTLRLSTYQPCIVDHACCSLNFPYHGHRGKKQNDQDNSGYHHQYSQHISLLFVFIFIHFSPMPPQSCPVSVLLFQYLSDPPKNN